MYFHQAKHKIFFSLALLSAAVLPGRGAGGFERVPQVPPVSQPPGATPATHGLQVFPAPPVTPAEAAAQKPTDEYPTHPAPKPPNPANDTPGGGATTPEARADAKAEAKQNQEQVAAVRAKVRSLVNTGVALTEQIHQDEVAAADAATRLTDGQVHLKQLEDTLGSTMRNLAATKNRLLLDRATLSLRLRDVYEQGNVGVVQVLLNSRNLIDFMNRREYARRVVDRDLAIVRQVHADENDLAAESQTLTLAQSQKAQEIQLIQGETQRLNEAIADRASILLSAEQQMESAAQSVSEMESESSSIESMLHRLQMLPTLTVKGATGQLLYHLHFGGHLTMPVTGTITSPFGYRYHPILHVYRLHTGVDIGAPIGTAVQAAGPGVVIHAGWLGGYGNAIIIDHGDGFATLYGHLSQIDVAVGQAIAQGQEIGRVGSTGLSTGPHLHFEVRKFGTPIPPF